MRGFLFAALAICQAAASADAAAVCATPQELKVLQAAVLQQQLSAAAQSCRFRSDYRSFVNLFNTSIVRSDQSLRAFFRQQKNSEGYEAYKARIAEAVSMHSLHDPRFCQSAKSVFDMALGRSNVASGVAPEAPALVQTGYEGCRPVPIRQAPKLPSRPEVIASATLSAKSLSAVVVKPRLAPIPELAPRAIRSAALDVAPSPRLTTRPLPGQQRVSTSAASKSDVLVDQVIDKVLASRNVPAQRWAEARRPVVPKVIPAAKREAAQSVARYAAVQPQGGNRGVEQDGTGSNIPNAYQPGSYWVVDGRAVRNDDLPPPRNDRADDDWLDN